MTKKVTEILLKLGAFKELKEKSEPLSFEEQLQLCPLSVDLTIEKDWEEFLKKYSKQHPQHIGDLPEENANDICVMGICYDKNLKDVIEESIHKGKGMPTRYTKGATQFCNFVLEDDSDFITIRVSPKSFVRFGKLIFEELKENDVIMVKGRIGSGIRMVFANYIVKLEDIKTKIESGIKLNSTEEELFKSDKFKS